MQHKKTISITLKFAIAIAIASFIGGLIGYYLKSNEIKNRTEVPYLDLSGLNFTWTNVPEAGIDVLHLAEFPLIKAQTAEHLGDFATYNLERKYTKKWNELFFGGIRFANSDSIQKAIKACSNRDRQCSAEELNALNTFTNLLGNFKKGKDHKDYRLTTLSDRQYFVKENNCIGGDTCVERQYVTFQDNTMISINAFLYEIALREKIDYIISQMTIK